VEEKLNFTDTKIAKIILVILRLMEKVLKKL